MSIANVSNQISFAEPVLQPLPEVCRTWLVGNKEINLLRQQNELFCSVTDHATGEKWQSPCSTQGLEALNIDNLIYYYSNCEVNVGEGQNIHFLPARVRHTWELVDHFRLRLVKVGSDLFFQRYNLITKVSSRVLSNMQIARPIDDRIAYLSNLNIDRVLVENDKIKTVFFQTFSLLDEHVQISSDNWAVTLISAGSDWHGHAMVSVEGIQDDGTPFIHYAHITGKKPIGTSNAEVEWIRDRVVRPKAQSATWTRTKEKVQRMINRINWEISRQQANSHMVFFNIEGSDSDFVQPVEVWGFSGKINTKNPGLGLFF